MVIKKLKTEIVYSSITKEHTFLVDDKEIVVREHYKSLEDYCGEDDSLDITEGGIEKLTEDEAELFGQDLGEYIAMPDGDELVVISD